MAKNGNVANKEPLMVTEPPSIAPVAKAIQDYTLQSKLPFWMNNLAENLRKGMRNELDITSLKGFGDLAMQTPAILVGAGPSVWKNQLQLLGESGWKHLVFATDRMLIPLLAEGIIPQYVASVDGDPKVAQFYKHELIDQHAEAIKAVLNVIVHPNITRNFKGEKYWFVSMLDHPLTEDGRLNTKSITALLHFLTQKYSLITMGHVGGFLWNLACYLGCNPIILIGYNLSYVNLKPDKTPFWNGYLRMTKGKKKEARKFFHVETNPFYNTKYLIEHIFMTYRDLFKIYLPAAEKQGIHTINCTEGGALWGDYIENMRFTEAIEKFE